MEVAIGGDVGLIIGTSIFLVFGLGFAFVLPRIIQNAEKEESPDTQRLMKWIKWLGLTLVFVAVTAIAAIIFLP